MIQNKLSQSSDEIAHTVNIFFEKKGAIINDFQDK